MFFFYFLSQINLLVRKTLQLLFTHLAGNAKMDEARRKREEKKVQRQRELESRRAARGPLKLGAKKI